MFVIVLIILIIITDSYIIHNTESLFIISQNVALSEQLSRLQDKHEKELQRFLVDHEAEKKSLIMRREDVADEQRYIILI